MMGISAVQKIFGEVNIIFLTNIQNGGIFWVASIITDNLLEPFDESSTLFFVLLELLAASLSGNKANQTNNQDLLISKESFFFNLFQNIVSNEVYETIFPQNLRIL